MTERAGVLQALLAAAALAACSEAIAGGPAGRCAEAVGIIKGLQGAVAVVGTPAATSEGSIEIEYEGTGAMNIPVKGTARCGFAVGDAGDLTLLEAEVDGLPLDSGEIDSIRSQLGERS